jgi:hypothetical protein
MPALPRLTAFSLGTSQLVLTYADGRIFYVNYADIITVELDPTSGETLVRIYAEGEVSVTLTASNTDLVALGTTATAFITNLNLKLAYSASAPTLGSKMELVTGSVTGKVYTAIMVNASTSFTTLTDSGGVPMLTAMNLTGITVYTGMIIRANEGKTIASVTVSGGNVFGYFN